VCAQKVSVERRPGWCLLGGDEVLGGFPDPDFLGFVSDLAVEFEMLLVFVVERGVVLRAWVVLVRPVSAVEPGHRVTCRFAIRQRVNDCHCSSVIPVASAEISASRRHGLDLAA
jgi:hypothetical protein